MLMPDPDNERRLMSIDDFLKSQLEEMKRKLYTIILSPLFPLLSRIEATWPAPDPIPNICIIKNAKVGETELRDLIDTICLAEGLLEHCLEAQHLALKMLGPSKLPKPFGYLSIAKACMMWSCAHEVFHYLRRHALVEKHFGSSSETKHALEYDADLCAAAALYRYLQHFLPNRSDMNLKKITLQLLYCSIRINIDKEADVDFYGSFTHPHTAGRILDIMRKLAIITDTGIPDMHFQHLATQADLDSLSRVIVDLELIYSKKYDGNNDPRLSAIFSFAQGNSELKYTLGKHEQWDKIQPLIDKFSSIPRKQLDNEASIVFVGSNFSLPR